LPLFLSALVVIISLLLPRDYTASAAFAPQSSSSNLARFAGVAAQLGVALPGQQATESPDFYADLLRSRQLLSQLVQSQYAVPAGGDTVRGTLIKQFDLGGADSARREDRAVRRLASLLSINVVSKTGVVDFDVTTRSPVLSSQIALRAIEVLNQFNLQRRQSRAGAERRFVESRLADAQTDLHASEDRLSSWLQQNRDYRDAPRLQLEYQRLQNEVALKQSLVTTLAQAYEQARIDEVRDTPVLTVVEDPIVPSRPDGRGILAKAVLTLILGFGLGALLAAFREGFGRLRRARPGDVQEARRLAQGLLPGRR
jgi:uncharacterized protein involved in exopolysaccharide biosynthesis